MWFGYLGPLEARAGERSIDLGPPKQRAVLAVLLVEANRVVPLERLVDLLWDGEPPARATGALQVYISGLRQAFEPDRPARMRSGYLVTQSPGYLLRIGPDESDAFRFQALAAEGRALLAVGDAAGARCRLTEGLGLWRGAALAEFAGEPFAKREATRLEELRAAALEDRIEADLALGHHADVVAELEFLVGENPFRERLWALLMRALYRSERQSEALRAYTMARRILREALGIEPGPALRQLEHDILQQAPALRWQAPVRPKPPARDAPPAPDPTPPPAAGVSSRGLVGRQAELRLLDRLLAGVRAGHGSVVLVAGEPGIGKTRLVEEIVARAVDESALVAWGRCEEGDGAPSFWPWVQVIRVLLNGADPEVLRRALAPGAGEIAQISPDVKEQVPEFEPPAAVDPGVARAKLFGAVNDLLAGVAASTPLVVVLDDLHWADRPSLHLVEHVAHRASGTGLLLVATFRDADPSVGGPLAAVLGGLSGHPWSHRLALGGLDEAECRRFVAETIGVEPSPAAAAALHARTDGNPFFVIELARLLASEGALQGDPTDDVRVPAGVRDVIRRRLERLPVATGDLLGLGAVIGRDVDLPVLAVAARMEEDDAAERLDAAVAAGLLVVVPGPAGGGRVRFSHALVQETIQAELSPAARRDAHARAATALRVTFGDDTGHAVERAHHLLEAVPTAEPEDAHAAALLAAEVCQRRLAYEQAEDLLRRALALAQSLPPGAVRSHRELDVQHRLATLLSITEGYHSDGVAAAWSAARQLSQALGDTPEVLNSLWGLARLTRTRGQFGVSVMLGEELLELARSAPAPLFALAGHEALGMAALFTGQVGAATDHLTEVVARCDAVDDADRALVLQPGISGRCYLACARWLAGDEQAADVLIQTARRVADASGHRLSQAIALLYSAKLESMKGDPEAVARWTDEALAIAARAPIGPLESVSDILGAWAQGHLGDMPAAEARFARALSALRASGWRLAMTYFLWMQADLQRLAGRPDQARATLDRALAEAEATGERYYKAELCRLAGERRVAGDRAAAETWLRQAIATADGQGAVAFRERAEQSLARVTG